ncbi:hypothetical protein Pmani_032242 [Petrolisthes manimaculis]|uniref:Uncharacterized protein n=1 Tax=Petrolisthes manimaculis TaxID=1843537 RepID=A0AAE1NU59_9EUCA|nr:hypothetical protein Pmani_032242 [Petrolisthes manimaculis]
MLLTVIYGWWWVQFSSDLSINRLSRPRRNNTIGKRDRGQRAPEGDDNMVGESALIHDPYNSKQKSFSWVGESGLIHDPYNSKQNSFSWRLWEVPKLDWHQFTWQRRKGHYRRRKPLNQAHLQHYFKHHKEGRFVLNNKLPVLVRTYGDEREA